VHFAGGLHHPLHEDNGDKGGNTRQVISDGHPGNPRWMRDTGPRQHLARGAAALAMGLESRITPQEPAEWRKGNIADWVMEGHRPAQTFAY